MIVGDLKPIEEIVSSISNFKKILVVGCGSCVTVCLSGGDKEARELVRELSHTGYYKNDPPPIFLIRQSNASVNGIF